MPIYVHSQNTVMDAYGYLCVDVSLRVLKFAMVPAPVK